MKFEEIGIAILDVYDDQSLIECCQSIEKATRGKNYIGYCITNRKTPLKDFYYDEKISGEVSFAMLRNKCIANFRNLGLKYFFLVNSNVKILSPTFFEDTLATANFFGTWIMTGYEEGATTIDDTEVHSSLLHINTKLNTDCLFIRSGVVGTVGYFDHRYTNTKNLDVLDFINRARKLGMYPPHPFHPTVGELKYFNSELERIGHSDILSKEKENVGFSYGYFRHLHGYVPDMDDIPCASKDQLIESLGKIQESYTKK